MSSPHPAGRRRVVTGAIAALTLASAGVLAWTVRSVQSEPTGANATASPSASRPGTSGAAPSSSPPATSSAPAQGTPQRWAGAKPLAPGEKPPQFVVLSWDGAGATDGLFQHYREMSKKINGSMTFFVTGIYMLPASKRTMYQPPGRAAGASDIGFLSDESVRATIEQVGKAQAEGHEIGTHFNGHFCGPKGGNSWTAADWESETNQAISFVTNWRANTGISDLPDFGFDYRTELIGSRTPCLEGRKGLISSSAVKTWRYDTSGTSVQKWPGKVAGSHLWDVSLQSIPIGGKETLSMDYNLMVSQGPDDPARRPAMQAQVREAYLAGFNRAYAGNRAPLIIGNHFEQWRGGIYLKGLDEAVAQMATKPDVQFVSFRQLVDWLDAQTPETMKALQGLGVGQAPAGGWTAFGGAPKPATTAPQSPTSTARPTKS